MPQTVDTTICGMESEQCHSGILQNFCNFRNIPEH